MASAGRIALDTYPDDWRYYTLNFPVARYQKLSIAQICREMASCSRTFYSIPRILQRVLRNAVQRRAPLISLVANRSYRRNYRLEARTYPDFQREWRSRGE
jgi:hypothetical protein